MKILVGLSGGVDSAIASYLLKKQGHEVIGVFMKNFSDTKNPLTNECSWREEKRSAQLVASKLKIPFLMIDYEKEYKSKVISPMFSSYKKNLTPNPDILCNKLIKFPALLKVAKKLNADFIATGHYARIEKWKNSYLLKTGVDKLKDQSYFLISLNQKILSKTLFPLGELNKEQVRNLARKIHLPNWNKKGTSGICFVGNIDMKKFLFSRLPQKIGKLLDENLREIGEHPGAHFFTIGERIRIKNKITIYKKFQKEFAGKKLYIARKIKNNLIVVPKNHPFLKTKKVKIIKFHLINSKFFPKRGITARIRHLGELHSGILTKNKNYIFTFKKGVEGVADGQFIALYKKDILIGGGEIRTFG